MQFLRDVYLRCPDCDGKRYRAEVLEVTLARQGAQRAVDRRRAGDDGAEALAFFAGNPKCSRSCSRSRTSGLDYLARPAGADALGRRGAAAETGRPPGRGARDGVRRTSAARKARLFLFDEPTTGLHFDDVAKLLRRFASCRAGHSLLVIEHNLDVIRAADWIIDLGPEGGDAGGEIVCAGTPRGRRGRIAFAHRQGAARIRSRAEARSPALRR